MWEFIFVVVAANLMSYALGKYHESRDSERREADLIKHYEGLIDTCKDEAQIYKEAADMGIAKIKNFQKPVSCPHCKGGNLMDANLAAPLRVRHSCPDCGFSITNPQSGALRW
jgi:excinuclease UvrABC ATPase subunit